jgi:hypothetical protein
VLVRAAEALELRAVPLLARALIHAQAREFTLIALETAAAFLFSVVALLFRHALPHGAGHGGLARSALRSGGRARDAAQPGDPGLAGSSRQDAPSDG